MFDAVELQESCGKAVTVDVSVGTFEERCAFVVGLEQARRMIDAAVGHALAEIDRLGECAELGVSTAGWFAGVAGVSGGQARSRVATARKLDGVLSGVGEALAEGRVSFEQARVIADGANPRVVDRVAELQDELVVSAGKWSFERFGREVRGIVEQLDQDGGYDPASDVDANRLSFVDRPDGVTDLRGTMVGDTALLVTSAVEARADVLFRAFTRDHGVDPSIVVPGRSALLALALAELVREAQGVDLGSTRPPRVETTLIVRVDDAFGAARTLDGQRLPAESVAHLRCDELVRALIMDSVGLPLWLGRSKRFPTAALKLALVLRDGGCTFPGCDLPASWCDGHHEPEFDDPDGRTDPDAMVLLCRRHHRLVHSPGWSLTIDHDQWAIFESPSGLIIPGQRHGRTHTGTDPPQQE